jgi:hypothetical protein
MANNRMYLECTAPDCLAEQRAILLAKTFGSGYSEFWHKDAADYDRFLEAHQACSAGNENVFRIVYEIGSPEITES